MTTEVYINDQLIDLEDETIVAASYGNISFGELNKRKGIKSNNWTAPFSQRNKLVFESCELVGSFSKVPYQKNPIRVDIEGVTVFEGYCVVTESEEHYSIQSFAGAADFYSYISSVKLGILDLSKYDHVWNETVIKNSWNNIEGFNYAFVEYGKEWPSSGPASGIPPDYLRPQIFFHTVIKQIATDAGYELFGVNGANGDPLKDQRFLKQVIIVNKFPLPITYGGTFNLSSLLPDLMQSKVWLDWANIYGLQFDINDQTKEIWVSYIDDILFSDPQDWTDKVDKSSKQKTVYSLEYGQMSKLSYKSEDLSENNSAYQDFAKEIEVDDTTLELEADVYKSEFFMIQDVDPVFFPDGRATTRTYNAKRTFSGIWEPTFTYVFNGDEGTVVWLNGTYYKATQTGINKNPSTEPDYWAAIAEKDVWDVKSRPMYGILTTDVSSFIVARFTTPETVTKIISNTNMDWEYSWVHHYRVFKRIIDKTKIVDKLMKLSYSDVNQIDFTKPKLIDGELYLAQEITQFRFNEKSSTVVNLIRI